MSKINSLNLYIHKFTRKLHVVSSHTEQRLDFDV